ncbi:MAG TPA: DUF4178 domain-containing protein, partial [Pyrinomonadaceae bacterium]
YLTFYQPLPDGVSVPSFGQLEVGQTLSQIPSPAPLMVVEKGIATAVAAEGEIPYQLTPNEQSAYADLSGTGNSFGTIDYSIDPPWVFLGQKVSLADIGLADARPAERVARRVTAAAMGCPNCGGPLELTVPDKAERVTCPNCDSLLDVNQGNLSFLKSLTPTDVDKSFVLPIGAEGTFKDDVKFKIIGAVVRSVTIEGETYYWHEYLLYNATIGFRWLVHSDNHWNFVEPVNPAEVTANHNMLGSRSAKYNGRNFKIFQDAQAVVQYVKGEFYWRVEQGETVRAVDYVSPPLMLSEESTGNEINWSVGTYMTNAEIEKVFGVKELPKPWSVAPNQPFTGRFYYTWGLLPLLLLIVVAVFLIPITGLTNTVHSETVTLQPSSGTAAAPQIIFSRPFELRSNRNVRITASAPVNNSSADLDIDLVNEQNNEIESLSIPISFYQGVEDGESWTEGDRTNDATLSSLAAGQYRLRVEGTLENVTQPLTVDLKVEQNVNRGVNFLCAFIVLLIVPVLGLFRKISFESRRWKDSMFSTSGSDE